MLMLLNKLRYCYSTQEYVIGISFVIQKLFQSHLFFTKSTINNRDLYSYSNSIAVNRVVIPIHYGTGKNTTFFLKVERDLFWCLNSKILLYRRWMQGCAPIIYWYRYNWSMLLLKKSRRQIPLSVHLRNSP